MSSAVDIRTSCSRELIEFIQECTDAASQIKWSIWHEQPDREGNGVNGGMSYSSYCSNMSSADEVNSVRDRAQAINRLIREVFQRGDLPVKEFDTDFDGEGIRGAENAEWTFTNALIPSLREVSSGNTLHELRSTLQKVEKLKRDAVRMYNQINPNEPYQEKGCLDSCCVVL